MKQLVILAGGVGSRLKARLGDREPEVFSECLSGLLACAPKENFPLVSGYLDGDDIPVREAAILALGRSRLPNAFAVLSAFWNRQPPAALRETVLLAMVMLRLPAATEFLSSWSPPVPRPPRSPPYPRSRSTRMIQGSASGSRR